MKLNVQIVIIDLSVYMPYQWALLKTYANQDPVVEQNVNWLNPLHFFSLKAAQKEIEEGHENFIKKFNLANVDVLGISCYIWNRELIFKIAEIVKKVNPKCLVVAGGPDLDYKNPTFFQQNPQIDIVVKKDGEIPFQKILLKRLENKTDYENISGLVVQSTDRNIRDTGAPEVLKEFPISPWLDNKEYFEKWMQQQKGRTESLKITIETNRGCPYSCTFCNWGSSTMSKLRLFSMDNVKKEIEWISHLGVKTLWIADANFGIIERDLEICNEFVNLKDNFNGTQVVFFAAKNHPERVADIALLLYKSGLSTVYNIGIQSTSEVTLNSIGRKNIKFEKIVAVADRLRREGSPVCCQLILGCPGETFESWSITLAETYSLGFMVQAFPFHVLINTEAHEPAYREKWKIKTVKSKSPAGHVCEHIVSTSTFTFEEYIEMRLYFVMARCLFENKFSNKNMLFFGIRTKEALLNYFNDFYFNYLNGTNFPNVAAQFNELRKILHNVYNADNPILDEDYVSQYGLDSNVDYVLEKIFNQPDFPIHLQLLNQSRQSIFRNTDQVQC